MNGAMAEPFASTSSTPTSTSVITMGAIQYFLFSLMNCHNSEMTYSFDINPFHTKAQRLRQVTKKQIPLRLCVQLCALCAFLRLKTFSRSDFGVARDTD